MFLIKVLFEEVNGTPCPGLPKPSHLAQAVNRAPQQLRPKKPTILEDHMPNEFLYLKVSYSCTTNMANIIKSNNWKILTESNGVSSETKCKCRNKDVCPFDGACLASNVI